MSAYFDGDSLDSFHLVSSPKGNYSPPMAMENVSPCLVACSMASSTCQNPSLNLSLHPVFPQDVALQMTSSGPSAVKSALRTVPKQNGRHVSWAEEVDEKAPLRLMELLEVPVSSSSPVAHRVWQLSQDARGTFEVQKALEECSSEEERCALAAELRGHVFEATKCPHANHVLRKIITSMPSPALHFIVVELTSRGPGAITEIARHRYGCRILEGLLLHCPLEQLCGIVECLFVEASALCMHIYGNYVMQRLLDNSSPTMRSHLFHMIHANLTAMGTNFYGSAVLGKAVQNGNHAEKLLLARAILNVSGLLAAIARYRHGKVIAELVLTVLEGAEHEAASRELGALPLKLPKSGRTC